MRCYRSARRWPILMNGLNFFLNFKRLEFFAYSHVVSLVTFKTTASQRFVHSMIVIAANYDEQTSPRRSLVRAATPCPQHVIDDVAYACLYERLIGPFVDSTSCQGQPWMIAHTTCISVWRGNTAYVASTAAIYLTSSCLACHTGSQNVWYLRN